jgi:hypothetical protein
MADDPSDLLGFVSSLGGGDGLRVEENLGEGYVRLRVSEAERRQAKHDIRCVEDVVIELLRNARDAGARRIFVCTSRSGDLRTTVVIDDGTGVPDDMRERIFEARVTSKLDTVHMDQWGVHGRGMALFSVRQNAVRAEVVDSGVGRGTALRVVTNANDVSERAEQSKWPTVRRDGGSLSIVRGPHNIVRTCCEFGLAERGTCRVYVGSPSEIVATIRARAKTGVPESDSPTVTGRLAAATDALTLREAAADVGIEMSERTAYRIVGGEIAPVRNVALALEATLDPKERHADGEGARISLSKEDSAELRAAMARDFSLVTQRYYLELVGEPEVRVSRGKVTVTFHVDEAD